MPRCRRSGRVFGSASDPDCGLLPTLDHDQQNLPSTALRFQTGTVGVGEDGTEENVWIHLFSPASFPSTSGTRTTSSRTSAMRSPVAPGLRREPNRLRRRGCYVNSTGPPPVRRTPFMSAKLLVLGLDATL